LVAVGLLGGPLTVVAGSEAGTQESAGLASSPRARFLLIALLIGALVLACVEIRRFSDLEFTA
jgi:hypothetical protein